MKFSKYYNNFLKFFLIGILPSLILILLERLLYSQSRLLDLFLIYSILAGAISGLLGIKIQYNKITGKNNRFLLIIFWCLYSIMILFLLVIFLFTVNIFPQFKDI